MRKSLVISHQSSVIIRKRLLFIVVFLLLTSHFSLSTLFADEIHSRAALVMDASTGKVLYAKNLNLKLPPASTAKLMTAIVAIEKADLNDVITISKRAVSVAPTKAGFKAGEKVTIETLLYAALLRSANDAATALAEAVAGSEAKFVQLMNRKAIAIGAKDTKFINPHGLPGPDQYITAHDLSKIMRHALKYPRLKEIIGTRVAEVSIKRGKSISLENTNRLLWVDEYLVGGKTGYTRKARHCFACACKRKKNTVVVALLGSPSRENLWKEAELLIDKGFQIMANKEEPVIYFTKADYDALNVKKASYKKSSKFKSSKLKASSLKYRVAKKGEDGNKG
ncbi:MAG: D-alanyl-D-alanine carboxypeptidase family protein [Nitrospirota bacterium]